MPDRPSPTRISEREPFAYIEHAHVTVDNHTVIVGTEGSATPLPASQVAALLVGPGCTISAAATQELARRQVTVVHVGEHGVRYITVGKPWSADGRLAHQHARLWADQSDMAAQRLYERRWGHPPQAGTADAIRGEEGVAARHLYRSVAHACGVPWDGRRRTANSADHVNRSLSWGGACVNALAATAVHAAGAVPALGFLHTGGTFSFVYDVADLARNDIIRLVFELHADRSEPTERDVRRACRDHFRTRHVGEQLIGHIVDLIKDT